MNTPIKKTPQEIAKSLLDPKAYEEEQRLRQEVAKKAAAKKQTIVKEAAPVIKQWWDVRVEAMIPAILTYRILAETPQEAADLIKGKSPNSVQHKLVNIKSILLKVYNSGGSMIHHLKRF
jgi:hypothetical protein